MPTLENKFLYNHLKEGYMNFKYAAIQPIQTSFFKHLQWVQKSYQTFVLPFELFNCLIKPHFKKSQKNYIRYIN